MSKEPLTKEEAEIGLWLAVHKDSFEMFQLLWPMVKEAMYEGEKIGKKYADGYNSKLREQDEKKYIASLLQSLKNSK